MTPTEPAHIAENDAGEFEPDHLLVGKLCDFISTLDWRESNTVLAYSVLVYLYDECGIDLPEADHSDGYEASPESVDRPVPADSGGEHIDGDA